MSMSPTPPVIAMSASPDLMLCTAIWVAIRLDEQAVATVALGPWMLRKCEMRFEIISSPVPRRWYFGFCMKSRITASL